MERVLSIKASELADNWKYEVHIITLNNGYLNPFYTFSSGIQFHDVKVVGNPISYFSAYRKGIKNIIKDIEPDVISVCDDGLKGLLFTVIFGRKIPVVYERHVSKQIEHREHSSVVSNIWTPIKLLLMNFGAKRFPKFVVLTNGNLKEWNLNNIVVIPNPLPFNGSEQSTLINKKVLVVGKQSYQKGYDRLLDIWSLVSKKFPNWTLEVYGKLDESLELELKVKELKIDETIRFNPPVKNIQQKYKEASIYVMTSRFEGFGMVLIEAMSYGVPCISFDCPYGPGDIIKDQEDGFLIENGNIELFADKLICLMRDMKLRKQLGTNGIKNVKRFGVSEIMKEWDVLFNSLLK